ncbi:YncE family protein [Duganella sp. HH105]|uniref:YncE family protein n=1 Tax=Duganella sp. HH105 TaxID=1781067 RepID=UPI000877C2D2|nr:hypothetical protein [Duganella sp. HH105]OEZ60368.1 hypothetical protein DUGA6_30980 [Duganella sp. HH105]
MIFIGDKNNAKLAAVDTLTPKPGSLEAKIFANDAYTWVDAAFDGTRDELYVTSSSQIDVYSSASKLDGTIVASRTIKPVITGFILFARAYLDKANDRLYVGVKAAYNSGVAVFEQASKLNGSVAPSRMIRGSFYQGNFALDLKRNLLYSAPENITPGAIDVFEHIDTATGELTRARTIRIPGAAWRFAVDSGHDRLYVVSEQGKMIIVDAASTAAGTTPFTMLPLPTSSYGSAVAIDATNDRLYAAYGAQTFVLNDASKLNAASATAQAAAISGPANSYIRYFAVRQ